MKIVPLDTNYTEFGHRVEDVAFITQMILGTVGLLGNILVCVTIARARFMHNVTNVFIAHMAMADVLVCMSLLIFQYKHFVEIFPGGGSVLRNEIICKVYKGQAVLWFTSDLSIYSMLVVTVERFVAIVRPLRYPSFFTHYKVAVMVSLTWFMAALVQTPLFVFNSYNSFEMKCHNKAVSRNGITSLLVAGFMSLMLPVVVLFWCYIRILISLRASAVSHRRENNLAHAEELFMAGRRVVKVLLTVSVLYVCIWFPVHILFCIVNFVRLSPDVEIVLRALLPTLAGVNSVVNPFVYAFKYKEFQRGVRQRVFPCCCYRQRAHVAPS
ncbi:delta-type opioid receptor-like [Asterias rubens]|uniref:delta-type opioid receptor-like n=1 Tax=Asterias rubens TaxID=7604 RepID=UPI001455655F|nr:delta-type opioid receptor-like [Asterias rubens]